MARILPLLLFLLAAPALAQGTLRIGIQDDPNMLDPAQSGAFVDRIAFAPICDRLVDLDRDLSVVPQLATGWSWSEDRLALTLTLRPGVTFHDGAPMDAEAVAANLERYRTARESRRKGELGPLAAVEVVDPHTVRLRLSRPYAPLLVALTDRAGMMLSPRTLADPAAIARGPVCAGLCSVGLDPIARQVEPQGQVAQIGRENGLRTAPDSCVLRLEQLEVP